MDYPRVILKSKEEGRLQKGHLWAFPTKWRKPPRGCLPVLWRICFLREPVFRSCFYHPHSLIAFRVLSSEQEDINDAFFQKRLTEARELRERLYPGSTAYRWFSGRATGFRDWSSIAMAIICGASAFCGDGAF